MTDTTLPIDVSGGCAVVAIHRPEVRNAVNRQVQLDIRAALDDFRDEDAVAVVVFTGAGEKALVAGADIAQALLYTTDDKAEGAGPFLAKRQPAFQGR